MWKKTFWFQIEYQSCWHTCLMTSNQARLLTKVFLSTYYISIFPRILQQLSPNWLLTEAMMVFLLVNFQLRSTQQFLSTFKYMALFFPPYFLYLNMHEKEMALFFKGLQRTERNKLMISKCLISYSHHVQIFRKEEGQAKGKRVIFNLTLL